MGENRLFLRFSGYETPRLRGRLILECGDSSPLSAFANSNPKRRQVTALQIFVSIHEHPAVDLDGLAGEIAGSLRGQEANDSGNFRRRSDPAQWNHTGICFHHLW
jgi:hypothetical protein